MKNLALILVIYWLFFRRRECVGYTTHILPDGRKVDIASQDIESINIRLFNLEQQLKNSAFDI
jgi:hypothetical protein